MNLRKVWAQRRPRGPARSAVLDPECPDRRELTTKPSAGANGFINLIVFIYHEVHEDHEVFFNLIFLCVFCALSGEITLSL